MQEEQSFFHSTYGWTAARLLSTWRRLETPRMCIQLELHYLVAMRYTRLVDSARRK